MAVIPDMETFLGKKIDDLCENDFHDADANHCAHFVSHAMGFTFAFNCRQFGGGNKQPANIRVHEIFAKCPRVGRWEDADPQENQLVFVTRKDVVDLATKTMQNIPQKHVGVYQGGWVYNYSNTQDRVVKQSIDDFLSRFQAIYSGDQGVFFGEFPASEVTLTVDATATTITQPYAFQLRKDGSRWLARRTDQPGSAEFLAGVEVMQPAKNYYGLYLPGPAYYGPTYDPQQYVDTIDQWAYLLDVTGFCESKNYLNLINTYDRARFTFGFYQLAAHTPRDNLILLFRAALQDEEFKAIFRDLTLKGGKVFRVAQDGTETDLEEEFYDPATDEQQIQRFMAYLNPERNKIDEQEVLQAARVVWWANNSPTCAKIQVRTANAILQRKMSERYARWYDLDGRSDVICAIVADIHHQGRAGKAAVKQALAGSNKVAALLKLGKDKFPERVATLSARIKKWTDVGLMGTKTYRASLNQFE